MITCECREITDTYGMPEIPMRTRIMHCPRHSEVHVAELEARVKELEERGGVLLLEAQIKQLAEFIMRNIPGEPSQPESAVDTAIRLLGKLTKCRRKRKK